MIVRAIDANGDWQFGNGIQDYKADILAVAQDLETRLNSFLGDCFFDKNAGIDWFNLLGGKSLVALNLAVSATIYNTQGVISMTPISINLDSMTRNAVLTYSVISAFGPITNQTTIPIADYLLTQGGNFITDQGGGKLII